MRLLSANLIFKLVFAYWRLGTKGQTATPGSQTLKCTLIYPRETHVWIEMNTPFNQNEHMLIQVLFGRSHWEEFREEELGGKCNIPSNTDYLIISNLTCYFNYSHHPTIVLHFNESASWTFEQLI